MRRPVCGVITSTSKERRMNDLPGDHFLAALTCYNVSVLASLPCEKKRASLASNTKRRMRGTTLSSCAAGASKVCHGTRAEMPIRQHQRDLWFLRILFYGAFILGSIAAGYLNANRAGLSRVKWLTISLLSGIELAGYVGLLLLTMAIISEWRATIRLHGWPTRAQLKVYRLAARPMAMRRLHQVPMFILGAIMLSLGINLSWRFAMFGLTVITLYVLHFELSISRPATMLFLASSGVNSIRLHSYLKRLAMDLRVVALLDNEAVLDDRKNEDYWMSMVIGEDCLRSADQRLWQAVVANVASHAPLVVLDARASTAAVVAEAVRLVDSDALYKTIFVGSEDGVPVLEQASRFVSSAATVVWLTEEDLLAAYRYVSSEPGRLPTTTRPIAAFLGDLATQDGRRIARYFALGARGPAVSAGVSSVRVEPTEALLRDAPVAGAGAFETRKCDGCGKVIPQDELICRACGKVHWFNIVGGFLGGLVLIAIAMFYCESWLWRLLWLAIGGANVVNWGRSGIRVLRRRRPSVSGLLQ